MPDRRSFLAGMFAFGLCPSVTWADAGNPAFLSAARKPNGSYALFGLSQKGEALFEIALPGRGHAAAAHPQRPEAVAFARRPGNFALVIDCLSGKTTSTLETPQGRHFYGHGAFSADGTVLFTPENDYENVAGVIGVWDVRAGYKRIGEFLSAGVGSHDIKLMPDGQHLVVANGGIETHPDSGREKLNIATMQPNLAYVSLDGTLLDLVELPHPMHKNSIRHLGVGADSRVAFAMQWQGDVKQSPALLGLHKRGEKPVLLQGSDEDRRHLQGYVGSVAYDSSQHRLAATSPRGDVLQIFDTQTGLLVESIKEADVCGVALNNRQLVRTSGKGIVCVSGGGADIARQTHGCQWDNHLVPIG